MPSRRLPLMTAMAGTLVLGALATPAAAQSPSTTRPTTRATTRGTTAGTDRSATGGTTPGTTVPAGRLATPIFSARRVPELVRAPVGDARLAEEVRAVLNEAVPDSCITVSAGGRVVAAFNGDVPLVPASTNKIVTAMAILDKASPDERVVTKAVAAAAPRDGVVEGDLWVVGGGDALLTTDGYRKTLRHPDQQVMDFDRLAERIQAAGVREVRGNIVGDDSRYDNERAVASWPDRYKGQDTVGPLSALVVNDGSSGYDRDPGAAVRNRKPGDPPVLAVATLKTLLERRGVRVTGDATVGRAPADGATVGEISTTIADQVGEMLAYSDNTTAELLTKEIGRRATGTGSTAAGTQATREVLERAGLNTAGVVLADGSGLDEGNRLTCNLLVAALDKVGFDSAVGRGMPVAGRSGTLVRQMRGTVGEGNVFAKTGTLARVTSLAGYEKTRQGSTVTFAFIQNGTVLNSDLQDKLAAVLYEYPRAPNLNDLAPPRLVPPA